ncbi:hypothetical protein CEE37_06655 [candidate division LCP-89 bacterium B3_LCP]|uniref:Secretion system C-terminal sorting domain-containing protein n=1 Tax=candidate division LCP-89 bacterium B3_LCP TaxID=2012998 RepID=A0A532V0D9_UNCL8|nr:MAG: hypothetical protein CEE37_06655 [candidate division LCP-89 bacterium B3_LCP]
MDWNEDGLKDLIVGEYNGTLRYYRNIGTVGNPQLTFDSYIQVGGVNIDIGSYSQAWINDWNEDSMKDLLVGASDGRVYLYINVGTNAAPVFATTSYVRLSNNTQLDYGSRSGPIVVDLNNDGVKDLVSGEVSGKMYYCQNNGTNEVPSLASPVALQTGTIDIDHGSTARAAIIDWDGDGTTDLVVGGYDSRLKLFLQALTTDPAPIIQLTNLGGYSIPGTGGRLSFNITINNSNPSSVTFDVWTEVQLPNSSFFGPLIYRPDITLDPYGNITRNLTQYVPGSAPSDYYYYYGYVGDQNSLQVYSTSYFYFNKLADGDGSSGVWNVTGWEEENICAPTQQLPDKVSLMASPNPFNPTSTVNFDLPATAEISLTIYNLAGQKVTTLVDGYREAGNHEATWNAVGLPSGVYFAHLNAGDTHVVQKLLLTK